MKKNNVDFGFFPLAESRSNNSNHGDQQMFTGFLPGLLCGSLEVKAPETFWLSLAQAKTGPVRKMHTSGEFSDKKQVSDMEPGHREDDNVHMNSMRR